MYPRQANSREYQQQAIDAEIKTLEESIRALKRRRNALAPISSLPTEVIAIIFSYLRLPGTSTVLSLPTKDITDLFSSLRLPGSPPLGRLPDYHLAWLRAAHICHQWREIALNQPFFWSHVDFTNITFAGATEILARAKKVPLHLEARIPIGDWDDARFSAFEKELQSRLSQICHFGVSAESFRLQKILEGLASPAPTLQSLSLSQPDMPSWRVSVPDTLFGGTTPRLYSLELHNCDISWKSPLLKGLRYLEIRTQSASARPSLADWLNALREMPQLEKFILRSASPIFQPFPTTFDIRRSVSLPSLTHLDISAAAGNCALALLYLFLPALTRLCVTLESHSPNGDDLQGNFLSLSRHAHGLQDTEPLQSVLLFGERTRANILAWPVPDLDVDAHDSFALFSLALSARVALSVTSEVLRYPGNRHRLLDGVMAALPLQNILTLTAQHRSHLDEQFWLRHASGWPLLQCVRLTLPEARGFTEMLLLDNGGREHPLLPSLTKLVLFYVALNARRTVRLCDALMKRVEQGVPLETLDLRTCHATSHTVQLLSEIVVDVWGPAEAFETKEPSRVSWDSPVRGPFVPEDSDNSEPGDYDDDEDDSHTSEDSEGWDGAEINVQEGDIEEEEDVEEGEEYSDTGDD